MKIADLKVTPELIDSVLLNEDELKAVVEIFEASEPLLKEVSLSGSLGDLAVTAIGMALRAVKANISGGGHLEGGKTDLSQLVIPGLEVK
jgi:hypothetical protein